MLPLDAGRSTFSGNGNSSKDMQRHHLAKSSNNAISSGLPQTAFTNRQNASTRQTNLPAPSGLKLPSAFSKGQHKKTVAPIESSGTVHQPVDTSHLSPVTETDEKRGLQRRGSYTISSNQESVLSPDGSQEELADSSTLSYAASNLLNTTQTFTGKDESVYADADWREDEFRGHLNRPVCISGAKRGVLRYFGPLHMVDGLFCGIELDEPFGQHDGQIDGRRYFRAAHNRGIFAPMEKVELIGKEPIHTSASAQPALAAAELIIPPDAEYLTDVEPIMCQSFFDQTMAPIGGDAFELSESLMFLKGSRFPGLDISMTSSQPAALVEDRKEELVDADLEADYLAEIERNSEDGDVTPVLEERLDDHDNADFDIAGLAPPVGASTPSVNARRGETMAGKANTARTFGFAGSSQNCGVTTVSQAITAPIVQEMPVSATSADTGYQGDTAYETQSGRSSSPREMDVTFDGISHQPERSQSNQSDLPFIPIQETLEKQEEPKQPLAPICAINGDHENDDVELLLCETIIRDSRGRVMKVVKETKQVPKDRVNEFNANIPESSCQLPDAVLPPSSPIATPSSPSKSKRTKSQSLNRESQRKPPKTAKVSDGANKNSQRDDDSRPSSGIGGAAIASPSRRRIERPEEPKKKIIKAPPKPSKHSEIMAKLQESMAQEKQKPRKEVKSKFMASLAATTTCRSDVRQPDLLTAPSRTSLLPTPRSRASSIGSSVNGGSQYAQCSSVSSAKSGAGQPQNSSRLPGARSKATTPSEEKRTLPTEQRSDSPPGKGSAVVRKGGAPTNGRSKDIGVSSGMDAVKKKPPLALVKKTNIVAGHARDVPGRPSSAAGATSSLSEGTNQRHPPAKRVSTTSTKAQPERLQELDAKAKQLKLAKERIRDSAKGFEAFCVLIRYYAETVVPGFNSTLGKLKAELDLAKSRSDELAKTNDGLLAEKQQLTESHAKQIEESCRGYEEKSKKLETDLKSTYDRNKQDLQSHYGRELAKLREENDQEQKRRNEEIERERQTEKERFRAKTVSLQELHSKDVADLQLLHKKMMDDMARRADEEKQAIAQQMDEMHRLCERYKIEARKLEGALANGTEKKMSAVSERFENYQSEIDSLRSVMEMKNLEMHELRSKCSLLEKELEELPKCRTRIALLEQKNAELKEALDLKKQAEKLFYQQHSELLHSCEKERERSQRLRMDKEQLEFRLQKLVMTQSAYETPIGRLSGDESDLDAAANRAKTMPRTDRPMSQSLIQIYAESSPWSPRTNSRSGQVHDSKDLVTVYMAAQEGEVAKVLQFDADGECSPPDKVKNGAARGRNGHSSTDSLSSPQTPPRGAKSVDKVTSPKRRISPLRRRNISVSGSVAPMPATPEHPNDAGDRVCSEPPPDCPKAKNGRGLAGYDGHDPQDPAPPNDTEGSTGAKTGCISSAIGWTDSGVFTTSCTSDNQDIATITGTGEHDSTILTSSAAKNDPISVDAASGQPVVNSCSKIPKKNGAF